MSKTPRVRRSLLPCLAVAALLAAESRPWSALRAADFRISTFAADVTVPLGHRCMGILPTKAQRIVDPLEARGLVLLGAGEPIVLVAVDWCEIRNGAYDAWREELALAAGTSRQRVLVTALHQHDAPVVDAEAQRLLDGVRLEGELFDPAFHRRAVGRVAKALRQSLEKARRITHVGAGQAEVKRLASNRRHVTPDGRVTFSRGSRSGANPTYREAPEGLIDPPLKTLSFWDGDEPLAAVSCYAIHPMSYYGQGGVSADFVGIARRRRQTDNSRVFQIYASGCSGDVTAGKYNDGSPANRPELADRLYRGMTAAWKDTERTPLKRIAFRRAKLDLEFRKGPAYEEDALQQTLDDDERPVRDRILAAMTLSSLRRVRRGQAIDVPCVDFGAACLVLLPGESFVGYQLLAQRLRPDSFVVTLGYGECWPGYIPTRAAFDEGFSGHWLWVAPGAEPKLRAALREVLRPTPAGQSLRD